MGKEHDKAFGNIKAKILNARKRAHTSIEKRLCLFTDASELHWASVLTQIPPEDGKIPFEKQITETLAFLSGTFTGSERNSATPDTEAFAIVNSCLKLDYLLMRPEGFIFSLTIII